MASLISEFTESGFVILEEAISVRELEQAVDGLASLKLPKAGTRNLLAVGWCRELAASLKKNVAVSSLLPNDAVAVQCTYFEKSLTQNWLVVLHRDHAIPVKTKVDSMNWSGWSEKEGTVYGRPPVELLDNLVAVRVHLEDNLASGGPLQVVPGSHQTPTGTRERRDCIVKQRGALVMRPLLLHASSKLIEGSRRVLHFLYGPRSLPDGAQWVNAV